MICLDYFSFVKDLGFRGLVLNISREMLSAWQTKLKIIKEPWKDNKEWNFQRCTEGRESIGSSLRHLDYNLNSEYITATEWTRIHWKDLLLSSHLPETNTTLEEYVTRMPEGQEFIYYATGEYSENWATSTDRACKGKSWRYRLPYRECWRICSKDADEL